MLSLSQIQSRWTKLRYWQRGAIIGGGGHLVTVILILLADLILVPTTSPPGGGDMGPASMWILFFLYLIIEAIPLSLLYLITGRNFIHAITDLREASRLDIWIWILFILYGTIIYGICGMTIGKSIESLQKFKKTGNDE